MCSETNTHGDLTLQDKPSAGCRCCKECELVRQEQFLASQSSLKLPTHKEDNKEEEKKEFNSMTVLQEVQKTVICQKDRHKEGSCCLGFHSKSQLTADINIPTLKYLQENRFSFKFYFTLNNNIRYVFLSDLI